MKLATVIGWAAIVIALTSCRSTKTINTAIAKKDSTHLAMPVIDQHVDSLKFIKGVVDTIRNNRIDFKTFSAKIKVDFQGKDGKKNDVNAFVRIKKDSIIWINVNAALGFDAFRLIITPDSVKVLNKLNKTAQLRSVEAVQEVTQLPMSFNDLQDLFMGNPIFFDTNINSYRHDEKSLTLICLGNMFKHLLTVSKDDYSLQYSKLVDVDPARARTANLLYSNYQQKNNVRFSTYRKITVSERTSLNIEMDFKQFDFNVDLSFPFGIPKNYKRI